MKIVTINSNQDLYVLGTSITSNPATENKPLNPNPLWTKTRILIQKGIHDYPAEIKDWDTIKALAKNFIITIGEVKEGELTDLTMEEAVKNKKQAESIAKEEKAVTDKKKARKQKLEELADLSLDNQYKETLID
jgi:hypothetical protein